MLGDDSNMPGISNYDYEKEGVTMAPSNMNPRGRVR